jgi:hypothetical protein
MILRSVDNKGSACRVSVEPKRAKDRERRARYFPLDAKYI